MKLNPGDGIEFEDGLRLIVTPNVLETLGVGTDVCCAGCCIHDRKVMGECSIGIGEFCYNVLSEANFFRRPTDEDTNISYRKVKVTEGRELADVVEG